MKLLLVFTVALACAAADVSHLTASDAEAPIVRSEFAINPDGGYQYEYETGNGISAQADGVLRDADSDNPVLEVKGSSRYTSPEGEVIELTYVANEEGYQPQGSHLPVAPPIPEAIARSLEYIAAHQA